MARDGLARPSRVISTLVDFIFRLLLVPECEFVAQRENGAVLSSQNSNRLATRGVRSTENCCGTNDVATPVVAQLGLYGLQLALPALLSYSNLGGKCRG